MENMEREIQIATNETFKELVAHQKSTIKMMWKMVIGCLITMVLTISIVVGGVLYFFNTYAIEVEDTIETTTTYDQETGENGSIINGNQFNDSSQNNEAPKGE